MAIARDANAAGGVAFSSSHTWNHTCSGSNRVLFIQFVIITSGVDPADGTRTVTYNGVAATEIGFSRSLSGTPQGCFLWVIENPSTGTNTVSVSTTVGTVFAVGGTSASYTGYGTSTITPIQTGNATATSITLSLTPTNTNGWTLIADKGESTTISAGTNSNVVVISNDWGIFDSNGTVATGGSHSMTVNSNTSTRHDAVMVGLGEVGGGGGTTYPGYVANEGWFRKRTVGWRKSKGGLFIPPQVSLA